MRKPRDFDSALRALDHKTKTLKETKRRQLGELIVATGADALDVETLAGGLLAMVKAADTAQKDAWRKQGAAFFRKPGQSTARKSGRNTASGPANDGRQTSTGSAMGET